MTEAATAPVPVKDFRCFKYEPHDPHTWTPGLCHADNPPTYACDGRQENQ